MSLVFINMNEYRQKSKKCVYQKVEETITVIGFYFKNAISNALIGKNLKGI